MIMAFKKRRVLYKIKDSETLNIGSLTKDKLFEGGYKIVSADKKSSYSISLLSHIQNL